MKQPIRTHFLNFLKHYFNPFTLRIARSSFGPFAVVKHVGRKSGRRYETPIIVRSIPAGFMIELTYGTEVDWYKNVQAAGGCQVLWHREEYIIHGVKAVDTEIGMAAFPLIMRAFLRLARRRHFAILLTEASAA